MGVSQLIDTRGVGTTPRAAVNCMLYWRRTHHYITVMEDKRVGPEWGENHRPGACGEISQTKAGDSTLMILSNAGGTKTYPHDRVEL